MGTVTVNGQTRRVFVPEVPADTIPVPVESCESGYKPAHAYRVYDAYMWRTIRRTWRMRFTDGRGADAFTDHPTLRHARQHYTNLTGLDLTE